MTLPDVTVAPGARQWCATNRRWFRATDNMAGACPACREQVDHEWHRAAGEAPEDCLLCQDRYSVATTR
jgi:hypothetical protein